MIISQAINKIMVGEDIQQQDLVISKLLRQDIEEHSKELSIISL
ncbi:MAG TPA: hypothetical protein VE619_03185 [Nitrososphaeraceae archaeon]|nr:hypothetical protein [Nitrososphaeraceae archaeon]